MRVLVLWPPHIPSYFNAGHHLPTFGVAAYLRTLPEVESVTAIDAGALNVTWKELADLVFQGDFDVIAIQNDFDAIDTLERLVYYLRRVSPRARLVTFGRLSNRVPGFFTGYELDGVVHSGDYEAGVAAFAGDRGAGALPGVYVRRDGGWVEPSGHGAFLPADEWVLPDVREIPYDAYERMYHRDENKFCGIPQRRELVVPVARGCPVGCAFCEVPGLQGRRERRLGVDRTLAYIADAFALGGFEYVAFYAPTFTLDRPWVRELCAAAIAEGSPWPWKCATTLAHLREDLVATMAEAGCVRISVGLETLDEGGFGALPRLKRMHDEQFSAVADWCRASGVELNCFVILGLPGTTVEGVRRTIELVRAHGARVRPTVYTPIELLRPDMTEAEIRTFNRHFLIGDYDAGEERAIHELMFGFEPSPTTVMRRVPTASTGR